MATYYHVHLSMTPGHSLYEAVVERVYFRKRGYPPITSRRVWYVPITAEDFDDFRHHRNQYRFSKWLMQQIRGVEPAFVDRY